MASRTQFRDAAKRLTQLEEELVDAVRKHDLAADGNERSDGHHHPAEAASDAEMREHDLRLQGRLRERMEQIERARAAIANGTYGRCVSCDGPIPEGRLKAIPDAERCVPCQTKFDRYR
ncbi:MAG: TraR/DksA C4-type zinc finger protein [Chloroflexota bacterium]|nr:TraR/DksA C4-type zinc finger protein [Chloroflexota bacterium]